MKRLFLYILYVCALCAGARAQTDSLQAAPAEVPDTTLRVSLLTCSPGPATYELYGHTALRVHSEQYHYDEVYNYGVFDFRQEHFVWHFVLGECDYMVAREGYPYFEFDYRRRGSSITEQVLNLQPREALALVVALEENCRPENCTYRYNIFRNNCTTKARDMIESHVFGRIIYPARARRNTYRTILHQFTAGSDWDEAGNDLLLGVEADTLLTERDEMFSPIYMMWYADSAMIARGYQRYDPLVCETNILLEADAARMAEATAEEPSFPLSPQALCWVLVALGVLLAVWEWRRRRMVWGVDVLLMTLQGLAGILVMFMMLFSEHPAVGSNWQVWVLNPLPLLFIPAVARADRRRQLCLYHTFSAAILSAFLLLSIVLPQDFSPVIYPLALLLLSRAIAHLCQYSSFSTRRS